jgi:hypothetical protein
VSLAGRLIFWCMFVGVGGRLCVKKFNSMVHMIEWWLKMLVSCLCATRMLKVMTCNNGVNLLPDDKA